MQCYCNVLPVFGFNSAKHDLNLIKSYLLPVLVIERNIEPTHVKRANQFVSFNFADVQLFDVVNFLGRATRLDSFLKTCKNSETKIFVSYGWFDHPDKMQSTKISRVRPSSVFFVVVIFLKPYTRTTRTY